MDIIIGQTLNQMGYDVAQLLPVGSYCEILSEMPPPTDLGHISRERFKRGSRNFKHLSETISTTNMSYITSPAAPCRLQNANKYCTNVGKTGPAGKESSKSVYPRITIFYMNIRADLVHSHTGYDVTSYLPYAFFGFCPLQLAAATTLTGLSTP